MKYKCNIIVCGPVIGKTYLAKHDDRFVDIDGMKADYKYCFVYADKSLCSELGGLKCLKYQM